MVTRRHKHFFIEENVSLLRFWQKRRQRIAVLSSKYLSFCCLWRKTLTSGFSGKFSRGHRGSSKISKRPAYVKSLQRTYSCGHTTSESFFIWKSIQPPSWWPVLETASLHFCFYKIQKTSVLLLCCFENIEKDAFSIFLHFKKYKTSILTHFRFYKIQKTSVLLLFCF